MLSTNMTFAEGDARQRPAVGKGTTCRGLETRQKKTLGELGHFGERVSRQRKAHGKFGLCRELTSRQKAVLGKRHTAVTRIHDVKSLPRAPTSRLSAKLFAERPSRQRGHPYFMCMHMFLFSLLSPIKFIYFFFHLLQSFFSLHILRVVQY